MAKERNLKAARHIWTSVRSTVANSEPRYPTCQPRYPTPSASLSDPSAALSDLFSRVIRPVSRIIRSLPSREEFWKLLFGVW